jgi:Na+/H+-dicarboxylate symporter
MLHVVMFAFPFFCFLALLYPLLGYGFTELLFILYIVALSAASLVLLAAFYLIRLLMGGVKLKPFLKHLPALLKENYKIGSVIDAVPFNIRYCVKNYGMDRKRIADKFTILAQINLDGNCYLIMLMGMLFIFMMVTQASWFHIIVIAIMVIFLSFGAPNQPGSILIGTLIIALFLKADVLIPTAVYLEVFFGAIQNLINVTGDIVTVAIEEKQVWK